MKPCNTTERLTRVSRIWCFQLVRLRRFSNSPLMQTYSTCWHRDDTCTLLHVTFDHTKLNATDVCRIFKKYSKENMSDFFSEAACGRWQDQCHKHVLVRRKTPIPHQIPRVVGLSSMQEALGVHIFQGLAQSWQSERSTGKSFGCSPPISSCALMLATCLLESHACFAFPTTGIEILMNNGMRLLRWRSQEIWRSAACAITSRNKTFGQATCLRCVLISSSSMAAVWKTPTLWRQQRSPALVLWHSRWVPIKVDASSPSQLHQESPWWHRRSIIASKINRSSNWSRPNFMSDQLLNRAQVFQVFQVFQAFHLPKSEPQQMLDSRMSLISPVLQFLQALRQSALHLVYHRMPLKLLHDTFDWLSRHVDVLSEWRSWMSHRSLNQILFRRCMSHVPQRSDWALSDSFCRSAEKSFRVLVTWKYDTNGSQIQWNDDQPEEVCWHQVRGSLLSVSCLHSVCDKTSSTSNWLVNGCSAHFDVLPSINWILGDGHHSIHSGLTYQLWWIPFMMVGWPIYRILTYINHETWPWHVEVPVNIHIFFFDGAKLCAGTTCWSRCCPFLLRAWRSAKSPWKATWKASETSSRHLVVTWADLNMGDLPPSHGNFIEKIWDNYDLFGLCVPYYFRANPLEMG